MQHDEHGDRRARAGGADAAPDPMTGRLLDGRYRIGSRIARGGMASVYEATDLRLDRTVAVKVMHPGLGDDNEFAERFVREARAAARLSHPNVVAVYDQGDDEGTVFLAMELIPGHTLRDVIRKESPMSPAKALAVMEPVLSALAAAHRAGLVHRDVKPENVLIADDGRVKVADFGLAKAVSTDTQHTATGGVLIGTVSYLAPELVISGRADARADVYAAGVVLFELLTGTKPHEGETPIQVAYKHVHEDVPAPSTFEPGLPAYVDALVARATARDRELRPADAAVLLHQVHRVSHALAEGVLDDAELTADLTPLRMRAEAVEAPGPDDTAPEPFDSRQFATMTAPIRTRGEPTPTPPRPAPPRPPTPEAQPPGRRRSRKGLVLLLVAVLLVVGGGAGAWWFLDGRYTSTPGVLGMTQKAAERELEAAGLDSEVGDPAYSETVDAGRVVSTDPEPGSKVLSGGSVTIVLSLGKERYDVPKLKDLTEDQAQDALTATHLGNGVDHGEVVGHRARRHRHRERAQGRHHAAPRHPGRPGRQQGPEAGQAPGLGRQERRQRPGVVEGQGTQGQGRQGGVLRRRRRGRRDLDGSARRHHGAPRRHRELRGLQGTRAGRGPVGPRPRCRGRDREAGEPRVRGRDARRPRLARPRVRLLAVPRRWRHGAARHDHQPESDLTARP